ncbi:MAG: hypothetical protein GY738_31240, partial [Pseudoalteromonas sp.]|nr:hypothetical protein [Pseudoalteromonas sp.]
AWTLWSATVPVPDEVCRRGGHFEWVCKATNRSYNTQPESARGIYNYRGLLMNAWHRVPLTVKE